MRVMELPLPPMSAAPAGTASEAAALLTDKQLEAFRRDGFVVVENLSTPDEIATLKIAYDRLFSERRGWEAGDLFDLVGDDSKKAELSLPQMLSPSRYEPSLRTTLLARNADAIARQILGPEVQNILEHAIMKPALRGAATPWHQDDAFNRPGSGFVEQITIWMPLQDVTLQSGCLQYIRGSNHGPLFPHRSPNNDPRIHGLEVQEAPDLTHCVPVPIPAGGAVIHHSRTLHAAGINTSPEPRRAYALGYSVQSRNNRLLLTRDHPWNLEKATAREKRQFDSLPPLKRAVLRFKRLLRGQKF